jgi:fibronectin type 3 domain-containing protein
MIMKRVLLVGVVLIATGMSIALYAQEEKPGVKLHARATQRSIRLRWAPNSPALWHFGNKYGYTLERIALSENNKMLRTPVKVILNKVPFKPAAEKFWDKPIDEDDYVAVAAQAIFGETFELTNSNQSDLVSVVNKVQELESRFSFSLFACDQSLKAAELSGLYFEDETISPNTKYLYRVYANIPENIHAADTGFVYVGLQDYKPLPKPLDLKAEFRDQQVLLSWNGAVFDRIYNSFWVERSDDGAKTFKKITEQPIVNTYDGDKPKTKLIFRTDSLPSNNVTYYYRISGINGFGENGPPSDTVSGVGLPVFAYSATIDKHTISNEGTVTLEWSFPAVGEFMLKSFDLVRVNNKTKVQTIVKKGIPKQTRVLVDEVPRSSNYYVIKSRDKYGRSNDSFPYFVQLEDSIPPLPPVELAGRIDTLGNVYLNWNRNAEEDLLGYAVYRSNFKSEEFIQVPGQIMPAITYIDSIRLDNLTGKIYYKVVAIDRHFNYSDFSEVLVLEKPDLIPPVPPVFSAIKSDSTGVTMRWQPSASEDVAQYMLYRQGEEEDEWILIRSFDVSDSTTKFTDASVKHMMKYRYTMLAVDDAGLESIPASPLEIRWIAKDPYPEVETISYKVDRDKKRITISWYYDQEGVENFFIYKSNNGEPLKLYKTVEARELELTDLYKITDTIVEYRIIAGLKTGEQTKSSKGLVRKM